MARVGSFDEQWGDRISRTARRFRGRVRPIPAGSWGLRPRNHEFDPCLVFWGMAGFADDGVEGGVGHWTVWFAFREPPYLHRDREAQEAEAIFLNDDEGPHGVMVPGFRFRPTVDGRTPVAEVEVLASADAEPVAAMYGIPYLLTWNCCHLANATMRPVIEAVCAGMGVKAPIICTPEELLEAKS